MTISQRELAKSVGVSLKTIENYKERLGITSVSLSKEEADRIREACQETIQLQESKDEKIKLDSSDFVANVRRIDLDDNSSVEAMLQDCKEQYVRNEEFIRRLQYEIDCQKNTMHGNANGTISSMPQVNSMERFQKVNIALRNQILQLESELGKVAQGNEDPFH